MKPKLNKGVKLTLDSTRRVSVWKQSTSLAKKNSYELNFPICLTQSHFLALSSRVSCINSLTSPTVLL